MVISEEGFYSLHYKFDQAHTDKSYYNALISQ